MYMCSSSKLYLQNHINEKSEDKQGQELSRIRFKKNIYGRIVITSTTLWRTHTHTHVGVNNSTGSFVKRKKNAE